MSEMFRSYMGPGACLPFLTRAFFASTPAHAFAFSFQATRICRAATRVCSAFFKLAACSATKKLTHTLPPITVQGYQPVSRIGEVVMNSFIDAVRSAPCAIPAS